MNYQDYALQKAQARERFGPQGTLICRLSAENLKAIQDSGYSVRHYETVRPDFSIPDDLHADVIFRIEDRPDLKFTIRDDEGLYTDI